MKYLFQSLKGSIFHVFVFSLIANILLLSPTLYMLQVYDRAIPSKNWMTLAILTVGMVFGLLFYSLIDFLRLKILGATANHLAQTWRSQVLGVSVKSGMNAQEVVKKIEQARIFIGGGVICHMLDVPLGVIFMAVGFAVHPFLGIFLVLSTIVLGLVAFFAQKTQTKLAQSNSQEAAYFLNNVLNCFDVIKSMAMVGDIQKRWAGLIEMQVAASAEETEKVAQLAAVSKLIRQVLQSLALGLGAVLVLFDQITPGMMIASTILLARCLSPIDGMIVGWATIRNGIEAFKDLGGMYGVNGGVGDDDKTVQIAPKGSLNVEGVTCVAGGKKLIENISFVVKEGASLLVLGPSGSGKTILTRALLELVPLQSGKIQFGGIDIFSLLDRQIQFAGYMPQNVQLLKGTVAQNIARFGEVDAQEVLEAAKIAGIHDAITQLPQGYETVIDPNGGVLSGGQKQRIGFARAIYKKPPLIVLDEPNSQQDDAGDAFLRDGILKLRQDHKCTFIIVSHKTAIVPACDTFIVLNGGKLVKSGVTEFSAPNNVQKIRA